MIPRTRDTLLLIAGLAASLSLGVPVLCLAAAGFWLLYRNLRRKEPLTMTIEAPLLAAYTTVASCLMLELGEGSRRGTEPWDPAPAAPDPGFSFDQTLN